MKKVKLICSVGIARRQQQLFRSLSLDLKTIKNKGRTKKKKENKYFLTSNFVFFCPELLPKFSNLRYGLSCRFQSKKHYSCISFLKSMCLKFKKCLHSLIYIFFFNVMQYFILIYNKHGGNKSEDSGI